jgi:hypothetical protein
MKPDLNYSHPVPPNSFSRELDSMVLAQEMPYGYTTEPPPADTGDFNQASLESKQHYFPYKKS